MQQLTALEILAEQRKIEIHQYRLPRTGSLCIEDSDGRCHIALDDAAEWTQAEQAVHLAHELGHCITGSFYNCHAACDLRQKHENRANRWAIRRLVDPCALYDALQSGISPF